MLNLYHRAAAPGFCGALLALLVACSGGATNAVPTATPSPAATLPPPVASSTPAAAITIEGDEPFVTWTSEALALIAQRAPADYTTVLASIRTIKSIEAGSGIFVMTKLYQVGNVTAHAPGLEPRLQLVWYAGTIVHDACHSARYERGETHRGKEAELACLAVQKEALLKLDSDAYVPGYVQGLIDNADDPANEYWNKPDRHW